ncbi:MAG TPA: ATP-binding cassette domain-containing protein [Thermoleophilaceae bacterium]|nr:ATP-binding cassette domain-containing protein [Thermoleophilaceae bacterium]
MSGMPAVVLENAELRLGRGPVWSDVSLTLREGEFAAVLGANGAGKTTLLRAILGLLPLAAGSVTVLGRPPGAANGSIGYLPQRRSFDESSRIRGIDVVRLGFDGDRWGVPLPVPVGRTGRLRRAQARERVAEAIELVGAGAYAHRPIGSVSGGEQQRLLIAQALVRRPRLLLLDEPLDSLDLTNQGSVAALVQRICRTQNVAVMLVAHDVNPILGYLDRVIYFAAGGAVDGTPREVINSETLSQLYAAPIEVLETSDGRLVVVGQPEPPAIHSERHAH